MGDEASRTSGASGASGVSRVSMLSRHLRDSKVLMILGTSE